jgi:hypothetical protein
MKTKCIAAQSASSRWWRSELIETSIQARSRWPLAVGTGRGTPSRLDGLASRSRGRQNRSRRAPELLKHNERSGARVELTYRRVTTAYRF